MRNKIIVLTMSLIMTCAMMVTAHAAEYSDVKPDDWYYTPVMQMTEDGILSGYGDGTFQPNKKISSIEMIVILERAFGDPANIPLVSEWETYPWHELDWLPNDLFMGDYSSLVSRNTACELLLDITDLPVLQRNLYDQDYELAEDEYLPNEMFTCLKYGYISGYGDGRYGDIDILTRAQACQILYNALYVNPDPDIPAPSFEPYVVLDLSRAEGSDVEGARQRIYSSLQRIPEAILRDFTDAGYTIIYAPGGTYEEAWHDILLSPYTHSVGVFSTTSKCIILNEISDATIIHEFGHFVDRFYEDAATRATLMREELSGVIRAAGRDYAETNQNEFFADAFRTYILKPHSLEEHAPKTYEHIHSLMAQIGAI